MRIPVGEMVSSYASGFPDWSDVSSWIAPTFPLPLRTFECDPGQRRSSERSETISSMRFEFGLTNQTGPESLNSPVARSTEVGFGSSACASTHADAAKVRRTPAIAALFPTDYSLSLSRLPPRTPVARSEEHTSEPQH